MLVGLINLLARTINIIVVFDVILSYLLSPYHPARMALDRITEPLLAPIRRLFPTFQSIDFSPMILLILIEGLRMLLVNLLS